MEKEHTNTNDAVKIRVNTEKPYEVMIQPSMLEQTGQWVKHVFQQNPPQKLCVVTDDNVKELYSNALIQSLEESGFKVCTFVLPHGEISKTLATAEKLLNFLADHQLTRSDALIALGGGVVGDLTGFAAGIYLRGIDFIQIPTTLLAAVDSSVGGKTGVNLSSGKNLAGVFWQPSAVFVDTSTLATLPDEYRMDGLAEAIKTAILADAELFQYILSTKEIFSPEALEHIIPRCIEIKKDLVESDTRDKGRRQLLNLGHTIGHAIEKCSDYSISHGHAVARGMAVLVRAASMKGWCPKDSADAIIEILQKHNFPLDCPYTAEELTCVAFQDKKRSGDDITLVIPETIGKAYLKKVPVSEFKNFIAPGLAFRENSKTVKIWCDSILGNVPAIASKSHAHRLLIAASLAKEPPKVFLQTTSADIQATKECLAQFKNPAPVFDCKESGSTLRFLLPLAMVLKEKATFVGSGRLGKRPVSPLKEEMEAHGCTFTREGLILEHGTELFTVKGKLQSGTYHLPGNVSSQFITGLLFALPLLNEKSHIKVSLPMESSSYVKLTLSVLDQFGIRVGVTKQDDHLLFEIPGRQRYMGPDSVHAEGDWSNAAFWIIAGILSKGSAMTCTGLNLQSLQGDAEIISLAKRFGGNVTVKDNRVLSIHGSLQGIHIDASNIPDLVPILAVAASVAKGTTHIHHAGRLRLKESDRLTALYDCLTRLGADVTEKADGLVIKGVDHLKGGTVDGYNDHRIVMAMAIASAVSIGPVTIKGADAVNKSYPTFFEEFEKAGGTINEI